MAGDLYCYSPEGYQANVGKLFGLTQCPSGWSSSASNQPVIKPGSSAGASPANTPASQPPQWSIPLDKILSWMAVPQNWKHAGLILAGGILIIVAVAAFGSSTKAGQTVIKTGAKLGIA